MKRATKEDQFLRRRADLNVPAVGLDRGSATPLHRQIARQIETAIRAGTLAAETLLPSTRLTARILGVSRNTVVAAYDELAAAGLVRTIPRAGVRVNGAAPPLDGMPLTGMHALFEVAHFPAKVLRIEDRDGNSLYLRY